MSADLSQRPVLLCDDGSDNAAEAMRQARALLKTDAAIALHVWEPLHAAAGAPAPVVVLDAVLEQLETAAKRAAEAAAERARNAGFENAQPLAAEAVGSVWRAIVETAHAHDAGVIVLGARGLTGVKHVLLGSVSEKVVRHAERPVLVLHPGAG